MAIECSRLYTYQPHAYFFGMHAALYVRTSRGVMPQLPQSRQLHEILLQWQLRQCRLEMAQLLLVDAIVCWRARRAGGDGNGNPRPGIGVRLQ